MVKRDEDRNDRVDILGVCVFLVFVWYDFFAIVVG